MEPQFIEHHKFNDRLISFEAYPFRTLVIGTFNPSGDKQPLLNLYDRGRNLTWGVLERLFPKYAPLKFYPANKRQYSRERIYENQMKFLQAEGIFLTDMIRGLKEPDTNLIYGKNYTDANLEKSVSGDVNRIIWNETVIDLLQKGQVKRVLFTRSINDSEVPLISKFMKNIETRCDEFDVQCKFLRSPSGSNRVLKGTSKYDTLVEDWKPKFGL